MLKAADQLLADLVDAHAGVGPHADCDFSYLVDNADPDIVRHALMDATRLLGGGRAGPIDDADMAAVEEKYRDFWARIVAPLGEMDPALVKRELSDFSFLLDQVPEIYMAVTGHRLSKTNYSAATVIREYEAELEQAAERAKSECDECGETLPAPQLRLCDICKSESETTEETPHA